MRTMLKGKIHRATVTEANVDYEGSITVDALLLRAAGILPFEQVQVLDINSGSRLTTYAIEGEPGSGVVCINGAAARLVNEGDLVIILAYDVLTEEEVQDHKPRLVYVNERNEIVRTARDIPVALH
jgi:aspartate 1-decarboxylase